MMFPPAHGVCARQRLLNTAVKSKNYNFLAVPTTPDMSSRLCSKFIKQQTNKKKPLLKSTLLAYCTVSTSLVKIRWRHVVYVL